MADTPRHIDVTARRRILKVVAISVAVALAVVLTGGYLAYRHLDGNITALNITGQLGHRPKKMQKAWPGGQYASAPRSTTSRAASGAAVTPMSK